MNKIIEMHEMSTGIGGVAGSEYSWEYEPTSFDKLVEQSNLKSQIAKAQLNKNIIAENNAWNKFGESGFHQVGGSGTKAVNGSYYMPMDQADAISQMNKAWGENAKYGQDYIYGTNASGKIQSFEGANVGDGFTALSDVDAASKLNFQSDMSNAPSVDYIGMEPTATAVDNGLGFDSMKGKGGVALGAANFGLGLANYLDSKKTAKLQRGLMQQQLASNAEIMANKRADREHIKTVFGGGSSTSGLKAV